MSEHSAPLQLSKAASDSDHAFGNEQSLASSPPICLLFFFPNQRDIFCPSAKVGVLGVSHSGAHAAQVMQASVFCL